MTTIGKFAAFNNTVIPFSEANLSIASSSLLYGLSIYTVFFAKHTEAGMLGFRIPEHLKRLKLSAKLVGLDPIDELIAKDQFITTMKELVAANAPTTDQCFRVSVHTVDEIPGVRTRNLKLALSVFMYEAKTILPQTGAKLKTSLWRRVSDNAIPARAKVNGAYVNSSLAKQDALDSGCDDCLFLNQHGYVSELSAANIFLIKDGVLITPDPASDILEGITRRSLIKIAHEESIEVVERKVALTELYTADEVFACGSSSFVAPVTSIDKREIGNGKIGTITTDLRDKLKIAQNTENIWTTVL